MAKSQARKSGSAEKIRSYGQQSRKNQFQSPLVSSATRKQTKRKVPVTRRSRPSTPMVKRQGRKVNVPLRTKGAELQLPAFPQINLGWRLISGAIFVLSLAVVFSFSSLDTFETAVINLKGSQRLGTEAILSQVDIIGKAIISIDPETLEQDISDKFPSLDTVKVSLGLPAGVTIKVTERNPIILWQTPNEPLWIAADGVTFPVRGEAETILTVQAEGDPPSIAAQENIEGSQEEEQMPIFLGREYPRTSLEFVHGILALREYLPEGETLLFDPNFGLGWHDPRGWMVYFGNSTTEIEVKLAEYETIITKLSEENLSPALISLEFLHSPFYRMEP